MPKEIDNITPEQEARIPEWVDKWLKVGLSTERMDREKSKEAVEKICKVIDVENPEILFARSPKEAIMMGTDAILGKKGTNRDYSQNRNKLYGGQCSAGWVGYVTFIRDVLDWENETLEAFSYGEELCLHCGGVWWDDKVVVIHDRPEVLKMNDENLLHSEHGPAIRYGDGWSVYAWNGTRIPGEWIEDRENLDPTIALNWENIEQRRCAAEIIGWDVVLDKLDTVTIDTDKDPEIGQLLEVDLPDIGKERFLRVRCGTGRNFALPVPPEMKTAMEAQAWTWGIDEADFVQPEVRT